MGSDSVSTAPTFPDGVWREAPAVAQARRPAWSERGEVLMYLAQASEDVSRRSSRLSSALRRSAFWKIGRHVGDQMERFVNLSHIRYEIFACLILTIEGDSVAFSEFVEDDSIVIGGNLHSERPSLPSPQTATVHKEGSVSSKSI